ncbi:MAG: hypothetical protein IPK34_09465 [Ramlibacter sp.]|nr:hypothetical protein [Ramlibacter sp.]
MACLGCDELRLRQPGTTQVQLRYGQIRTQAGEETLTATTKSCTRSSRACWAHPRTTWCLPSTHCAHAAQHFAMEDEHLRDMKDGNSKCHLDEHANVLKSFDEVREVLVGAAHPPEMKQRVVQSLSVELLDWLPHHVQEMDAGVATHRSKQRSAERPFRSAAAQRPELARPRREFLRRASLLGKNGAVARAGFLGR